MQSGKLNFASFDEYYLEFDCGGYAYITNYNTGKLLPTSTNKSETGVSISSYLI